MTSMGADLQEKVTGVNGVPRPPGDLREAVF
jgi:hypothetical protein